MPDLKRYVDDYGRYRLEYPDQFFERLERLGIGKPGQRVLDLGTGTGILARGFARRHCLTSGLDSSAAMLDKARQLDQAAGVTVNYVVAAAEQTGLPAQSFDVVASSMAWFFFERARAMREAQRLLVPGGALVLAHLHRLALPGSVTEATNRLIEAFQLVCPTQEHHGLKPDLVWEMDLANLERIESFSFNFVIPYTHDAWCGRIHSIPTVGGRLAPAAVESFATALRTLLARSFPQEPMHVAHRVFAAIGFRR